MDEILFPSQYKSTILKQTKNTTIRIGKEIGKYKQGKIYLAKSYTGKPWGIKIRVADIKKTTLGELQKFGIPKNSITATLKKEKISLQENVELIKFEYV